MNELIGNDIEKAAELLVAGQLVAIPTETVYGLAAHALNEEAVANIFKAKNRPPTNPLIIHLANKEQISDYVTTIPGNAHTLIERFCPGPLTVVLPAKDIIPSIVTAGRATAAIRIPAHPVAHQLLTLSGIPLAAPSANPSGYISPTRAEHVLHTLGNKVSYILDGGECAAGIESTIVGFEDGIPVIYRQGIITADDIKAVTGVVRAYSGTAMLAPGMSAAHYSPKTPLLLTDSIEAQLQQYKAKSVGIITYDNYVADVATDRQILLCTDTDLGSAARNLYAAMHTMDNSGYDIIIAKKFPDASIGRALNDRLQRAAAK